RDVAQDVRELERDAEIERVVARAVASAADDLDADKPDGRGDAPAVLKEVVERLIPVGVEVHRDAVNYIFECLPRQVERADERLQMLALRGRWRRPVVAPAEFRSPELHRRAPGGDR